jgi:hypothetical protein
MWGQARRWVGEGGGGGLALAHTQTDTKRLLSQIEQLTFPVSLCTCGNMVCTGTTAASNSPDGMAVMLPLATMV